MVASTLAEVARLAGVSPATASRVLNGSARKPGPDIANRVRQAAESLGYVANAQAQGLAKSSSGLIGLVVHDIADPYFASIARGVQVAARNQGRMVLLATAAGAPEAEREAVAAFAARRADSIVLAGSRSARKEDTDANSALATELDRYCANGGQVAVVGHPVVGATSGTGYHVVAVPNEALAASLAADLTVLHTGRFIVVAGPESLFTSDDRIRGFQAGLAAAGREPAEVFRTQFTRSGGHAAGLSLARRIAAGEKDLCIFAVNDAMAIGVAAAIRGQDLRIPRDALIAGFDDIETLRDFQPELSTVHLPLEDIGAQAARRAGGDMDFIPITGHVALRRSTHHEE